MRYLSLIVLLCSFHSLSADNPYYLSVGVAPGDGIITLLTKYDLIEYECNKTLFLELNGLEADADLLVGREYQLPIKIYAYDGKSIRSTVGIDDYRTALRIQKYNEAIHKKGMRQTDFRDSKILWVPNHEIACNTVPVLDEVDAQVVTAKEVKEDPSPARKVSGNMVVNKLFGSEYEEVMIEDRALENQVFYIVSGHGGPDPGAVCTDCVQTMCEDEYAYDVSLRLARNLTQHGATVHMIIEDESDGIRDDQYLDCDNDEQTHTGRALPLRQLDRLKQRSDAINTLYDRYKKKGVKSQKAIMIHVDSRSKDKRQDVFFYYWGESQESKDLAYGMKSTFEEKYEMYQKGRGYHGYVDKRGLYMLRTTKPTALYVELANIRNKEDHKRLIYHTNRQALANWLFEGLTK